MENLSFINNDFHHGSFKKHFHEEYSIALIYRGEHKFSNEKEKFLVNDYAIRVINPYEYHTTFDSSWSYVNFMPSIDLINSINEKESKELQTIFNPIITDKLALDLAKDLFLHLKASKEKMPQESALINLFSYLMNTHSQKRNVLLQRDVEKTALEKVLEFIDAYFEKDLSLEDLVKVAGVSKYHLLREFKKTYGVTPYYYIHLKRVNRAKELFAKEYPMALVAKMCGFTDQAHMVKSFKKVYGFTPSKLNFQKI